VSRGKALIKGLFFFAAGDFDPLKAVADGAFFLIKKSRKKVKNH
jgi:hypothetical protein